MIPVIAARVRLPAVGLSLLLCFWLVVPLAHAIGQDFQGNALYVVPDNDPSPGDVWIRYYIPAHPVANATAGACITTFVDEGGNQRFCAGNYKSLRGGYQGPIDNLFNYGDKPGGTRVFTDYSFQQNGGTTSHVGYYAWNSGQVFSGDTTIWHREDCTGTSRPIGCAGHATVSDAVGSDQAGTPLGTISPFGSMRPIPVPRIASLNPPVTPATIDLVWDAAYESGASSSAAYILWYAVDSTCSAPTDAELTNQLNSTPITTTSTTVDVAADLGLVVGSRNCVTFALQIEYINLGTDASGAVRSRFKSANSFPVELSCPGTDDDGDDWRVCQGDCDDNDATTYPGAPQLCDGVNNDCDDLSWPVPPPDETDDDSDTYRPCSGDCDDDDFFRNPGVTETCNGIDDDCNTLVDDDALGEDSDGDTIKNVCDNCPSDFNTDQLNADGDLYGNACDNCLLVPNDQTDTDSDSVGNACDNCPASANTAQGNTDADSHGDVCDNCIGIDNENQLDADGDLHGDACDNCLLVANDQTDMDSDTVGDACDNCPDDANTTQENSDNDSHGDECDNCADSANESQADLDTDGEGDECDLDDGVIFFLHVRHPRLRWQPDPAFMFYNLYRGSLGELVSTGVYTQVPGSNPYADRICDRGASFWDDAQLPAPGDAMFWLVTGEGLGGEGALGDGTGVTRPNDNPCP